MSQMMGTLSIMMINLLVGCAITGDVTRHESSVCEVHGVTMSVKEVPCKNGWSGYLPEYPFAMRKQFPHHGGVRFAEDHVYLSANALRTHVCPRCNDVYEQWCKQNDWQIGLDTSVGMP